MGFWRLFFHRLFQPSLSSGEWGEEQVRNLLLNNEFYSINDAHIYHQQIDHILICKKGVFVIETKNLKGIIYGNSQKNQWSQVFECNSSRGSYCRKFEFYNPVMQNKGHALALHRTLKWKRGIQKYVNPIVVFTHPNVILRVNSPEVPILKIERLIEYINGLKDVMTDRKSVV